MIAAQDFQSQFRGSFTKLIPNSIKNCAELSIVALYWQEVRKISTREQIRECVSIKNCAGLSIVAWHWQRIGKISTRKQIRECVLHSKNFSLRSGKRTDRIVSVDANNQLRRRSKKEKIVADSLKEKLSTQEKWSTAELPEFHHPARTQ